MAVVAVDIGAENTKIAWLEQKNGFQLLDAFLFKTPYTSAAQHRDLSQIELNSFWKQISGRIPLAHLKRSKIGIGLPSNLINTILVSLPKMSVQELYGAAIVEAKRKMIPASTAEHLFERYIAGEFVSANVNRCVVVVIRTEKGFIQNILDIFKPIDVIPSLIIPSCCAIPALVSNDAWGKDEDAAFIDFGAGNLNISICRSGKLVFTRSLGYSLGDIIADMSGQLGITKDEMIRIVMEEGIPPVDFDLKNKAAIAEEIMRQKYNTSRDLSSEGRPVVHPLELRMIWQAHIERMVQEFRRSFIFYKEQSEGRRIERVYCLGGGSLIKNLNHILSGLLGGQLRLMPPFNGLKTAKDNIYTEASGSAAFLNSAVSIALSVYAKSNKIPLVNFLPAELKRKEAASKRNLALFAAGVCLAFVFALAGANVLMRRGFLQSSISAVEAQLGSFKNVKDNLDELSRKKDSLNRQLAKFAEIKQNLNWAALLKKTSLTVPKDIVLTQIVIARGEMFSEAAREGSLESKVEDKTLQIRINARILADYEKAQEIIENFRAAMEKTGYLAKINIPPLGLEEIIVSDTVMPSENSAITRPQAREFSLEAEVVLTDEKK